MGFAFGLLDHSILLVPIFFGLPGISGQLKIEFQFGEMALGFVEVHLHCLASVWHAGEMNAEIATLELHLSIGRRAILFVLVGVEPTLGKYEVILGELRFFENQAEGGLITVLEVVFRSKDCVGYDGGHEFDGPCVYGDEEDAVVDAVGIRGHEEVNIGVCCRRKECFERHYRIHDDGVGVEPALMMVRML